MCGSGCRCVIQDDENELTRTRHAELVSASTFARVDLKSEILNQVQDDGLLFRMTV